MTNQSEYRNDQTIQVNEFIESMAEAALISVNKFENFSLIQTTFQV
jgi:hypothetical protein